MPQVPIYMPYFNPHHTLYPTLYKLIQICYIDLTLVMIQYDMLYPSFIASKYFKILGTNNKIHHIFGCIILVNLF